MQPHFKVFCDLSWSCHDIAFSFFFSFAVVKEVLELITEVKVLITLCHALQFEL